MGWKQSYDGRYKEYSYLEDGTGGKQTRRVHVTNVILISTVKIKFPPRAGTEFKHKMNHPRDHTLVKPTRFLYPISTVR
jgi:hypothetical protein